MHELSDPADYQNPCSEELYNAWTDLSDELFGRIEAILDSEGDEARYEGRLYRAAPFMARNGYADANGWWVAE